MRFVLLKIMLAPENCQSLKINDVIWLKCSEQTMFRIASHSNVIWNMHKKYLLCTHEIQYRQNFVKGALMVALVQYSTTKPKCPADLKKEAPKFAAP